MKSLIIKGSTLLAAIILFAFSACKKNTYHGTITANIDGYSFIGNSITKSEYGYTYTTASEYASDSAVLILSLTGLQPGTYLYSNNIVGYGTVSNNYIEYIKGKKEYYTVTPSNTPSPGAIIITSHNSNGISGTFTGTLYYQYRTSDDSLVITNDSVVITNGVFANLY